MEDEFEVAELTQLSSTLPFPRLRKLELISSWTLWLAVLGCGLTLNVFPRELWICSLSDCRSCRYRSDWRRLCRFNGKGDLAIPAGVAERIVEQEIKVTCGQLAPTRSADHLDLANCIV